VQETPRNDYRYRARISREEVATVISDAVRNISYPNFKDTVQDRARHHAHMDVWKAMYGYQQRESGSAAED
jgi:hypothetical protein